MEEDIIKFDRLTREMLMHEDSLVNNRLTWIWTLQGLLFTSYAIGYSSKYEGFYFLIAVTIIGVFVSASIGYNLICSHKALHNIHKYWNREIKPKLPVHYPPLAALSPKETKLDFLLPWRFLPYFFLLVWTILLIITVYLKLF